MEHWLVVSTPLKNMKDSWDDDIPNWMESHNPAMFQSPPSSYEWNMRSETPSMIYLGKWNHNSLTWII